jgi:hypothetical protein
MRLDFLTSIYFEYMNKNWAEEFENFDLFLQIIISLGEFVSRFTT